MKKLNVKLDCMNITEDDIENIKSILNNSQMSVFNSELIRKFEKNFEAFLFTGNQINTVTFPNCTSAIFVSLQLLDLKEGDEVIVPNITHSSSIYPIIYTRKCKIKVCEFKKNSYDLDLEHLKSLITKKTKAILVCYLHGFTCNVHEILKICNEYGIKLIEDAAQGLGVKIHGKMAGTMGDYGCFSFGENKLLKMGEGGSLFYKKEQERNMINKYRHVGEVWKNSGLSTIDNNETYEGILKNGVDYFGEGFNFRCNPLNIALGISPLQKLDDIIKQRQNKVKIYKDILKDQIGIKLINDDINESAPISAWFIIDPEIYEIDIIILKCIELGIPIGKFKYPTITKIQAFENYIVNKNDLFYNSENIKNSSIFIPVYENLSIEDVRNIGDNIKEILQNYNDLKIDKEILKKKIDYFDGFFIR
ncbi:MAG: aminotransferase class V-fold PLP-dependent enzyme [Bacilli bacterium]